MNEVLREFKFTKSFFDDCLIFGNKDEHISQVEKVLKKFAELGIHVNMSKCQFVKAEVNFIGLTITNAGIRPNANKLQELVEFNKPENTKELRSFLVIASYFRRFINKFSETASSLYALLKKNVPFVWSEECETSYNKIRTGLQTAAVLRHPDNPFVLTTEASNQAIGFTLLQEINGELVPISYGGRVLTDHEKRYSTTDKELLAVYFAVKKLEYYLIGHTFVVYTDHKPLVYLKAFKDIVNKRFRWVEYLECQYRYSLYTR